MRNHRDKILAFFLYLTAAIILTFPLILHLKDSFHFFSSVVPPQGQSQNVEKDKLGSDTLLDVWTHWFFRKSLSEGRLPLSTDLFYGVAATPIAASINDWLSPTITYLLFPFLGLLGSFNLQTILTLALNGWAAYLLAGCLTKSKTASFLAGLFLLTSSYVYNRSLEHLGLSSVYFSVFFLLFFFKALESNRRTHWLLAGLCLAASGLLSWYFFLYGLLLSTILFAYLFLSDQPGSRKFLINYLVFVSFSLILLSPFLLLFLKLVSQDFFRVTYLSAHNFSADLFSLLLPSPGSLLWGNLTRPFYAKILFKFTSPIEKESAFLGFLGLTASIFFILRGRHPLKKFFLLIFFSSLVFSLGPFLTILGRPTIPLPYQLLSPIFPILQSPTRFVLFALIPESLFVAYFLETCTTRIRGRIVKFFLMTLVGVYLFVENSAGPYRLASFGDDNPFYKSLRESRERKIVLNLPVSYEVGTGNIFYLSQQTLFQQPMLNGYSAPLALPFILKTPYYAPALQPLACSYEKGVSVEFEKDLRRFLRRYKISYLLIQKRVLELEDCRSVRATIDSLRGETFWRKKVFEDKNLAVYKVT